MGFASMGTPKTCEVRHPFSGNKCGRNASLMFWYDDEPHKKHPVCPKCWDRVRDLDDPSWKDMIRSHEAMTLAESMKKLTEAIDRGIPTSREGRSP